MDKSELMIAVMDRYGVRYKPSYNGWQSVHCPNEDGHVHGDKNPSGRLNLTLGGYTCMGCDMKGDGYNLLMEMENLTFPQAKEQLGSTYVPIESDYLI